MRQQTTSGATSSNESRRIAEAFPFEAHDEVCVFVETQFFRSEKYLATPSEEARRIAEAFPIETHDQVCVGGEGVCVRVRESAHDS